MYILVYVYFFTIVQYLITKYLSVRPPELKNLGTGIHKNHTSNLNANIALE